MTYIVVNIETPGLSISDCMIPADYTPERVVSDLTDELNLPRVTDAGAAVTYSLLHVDHNLMLPEGKTLVEAGVQSGHTVQLVPAESYVSAEPDPAYFSPRHRRLATEYTNLMKLAARSRLIKVEPLDVQPGWPPEKYVVTYTCKGIIGIDHDENPVSSEFHQVLIHAGRDYPMETPYLRWLTPIWHPNVGRGEPHHVSLDLWTPWYPYSSLDDLVVIMGQMAQYKRYHARSEPPYPLDLQVAEWVVRHAEPRGIVGPGKPYDPRPLLRPRGLSYKEPPEPRRVRMGSPAGVGAGEDAGERPAPGSEKGEVEVVLSVLDLNRSERVALSQEATARELVRSVMADYNLPRRDKVGDLIHYKLRSKALARFLGDAETLSEAGVPVWDRLTLHREELAGGDERAIPFEPESPSARAGERRFLALSRGVAERLKRLFGRSYDPVDCTVYAPPAVARRGACLVQVFVYEPEQAFFVAAAARGIDQDATPRGFGSLGMKIARGSKLTFHLALSGIKVEDPFQDIIWDGSTRSAQFGVEIPAGHPLGDLIGTVRISYEGAPLGHIKFKLTVVGEKHDSPPPEPVGKPHTYRKAFVSYAAGDRTEVLKRVQMLPKLRIKTFQDVLNLEPGARWERELYRHIEESDLFLLFWSSAASRSEWVLEEVRYALKLKAGDEFAAPEIIPVPIEGPPPVPPPDELSHLHFDDYYLYFMAAP